MFGYVVNMATNIKQKNIKNNTIFLSSNLTYVLVILSFIFDTRLEKQKEWYMITLHSKNYKIFQNFGFPKMGSP